MEDRSGESIQLDAAYRTIRIKKKKEEKESLFKEYVEHYYLK